MVFFLNEQRSGKDLSAKLSSQQEINEKLKVENERLIASAQKLNMVDGDNKLVGIVTRKDILKVPANIYNKK